MKSSTDIHPTELIDDIFEFTLSLLTFYLQHLSISNGGGGKGTETSSRHGGPLISPYNFNSFCSPTNIWRYAVKHMYIKDCTLFWRTDPFNIV